MMLPILSQPSTLFLLEGLLQTVLSNVLHRSYCLTFVMEEAFDFRTSLSFVEIVTNASDYERFVEQVLRSSEIGCSDFIVRIKQPALFVKALEKATHLGTVRRGDKKIIIIGWDEDTNMLDIFVMKEISYIPNVVLMLPVGKHNASGCAGFDIFTHQYVGPDETSNSPKYLDRWNSCKMKFDENANLFPHTNMSRLNGKTLKVGSFTYLPFTNLDLTKAPLGRDGTEIRMIEEFCRRMNCTIKIVANEENNWGEIYNNMTGSGVLGSVVEDHADIGLPVFTWYHVYIWLDFSFPSIRSGVTCIAPAPRLLVSWDMPLLPFRTIMWLGMILTFVFSAMALAFAQRSFDKAILTTFGILTAQARGEICTQWRVRSITGWLILTSLVLSNAYSAGLSTTYTVPEFEKGIDTIQDLVDRKMEWGGTDSGWVLSISLSEEPLIKQLISQFRALSAKKLRERSLKAEMAFAVEKLPTGCFGVGEYITQEAVSEYQLIKEDFYFDFSVAILRKSSPYTQKITELVLRLHEVGLMLAFEAQVALSNLDYKVQNTIKSSRSKQSAEVQPLSIRHVVGVFYMYFVGVGLSLVVFIVEVTFKREIYNDVRHKLMLPINL